MPEPRYSQDHLGQVDTTKAGERNASDKPEARSANLAPFNLSRSLKPAADLASGAGEGIRTLDPNLGKVVLYH